MSGQAAETRRHQEDGERLKATSARHIHSNSRARTQQWKAGACEALKQAQATNNKHRPGSNGNGTVDTVRAIVGADWYGLDMLQSFCPELKGKWGIAPLPKWSEAKGKTYDSATFAGQGLMIYKGSKQVDKSWEFMKWVMTDKEANVARFTERNSFPAYRPVWSDARLLAQSEYFSNEPLGLTVLQVSKELPPINMNAKRGMAVFLMREKYFASVMMGYQTATEALTELKAALDNPQGQGPQ